MDDFQLKQKTNAGTLQTRRRASFSHTPSAIFEKANKRRHSSTFFDVPSLLPLVPEERRKDLAGQSEFPQEQSETPSPLTETAEEWSSESAEHADKFLAGPFPPKRSPPPFVNRRPLGRHTLAAKPVEKPKLTNRWKSDRMGISNKSVFQDRSSTVLEEEEFSKALAEKQPRILALTERLLVVRPCWEECRPLLNEIITIVDKLKNKSGVHKKIVELKNFSKYLATCKTSMLIDYYQENTETQNKSMLNNFDDDESESLEIELRSKARIKFEEQRSKKTGVFRRLSSVLGNLTDGGKPKPELLNELLGDTPLARSFDHTLPSLRKTHLLNFDVFSLEVESNGNAAFHCFVWMLLQGGDKNVPMSLCAEFAHVVQNGYYRTPYHNKTHAAAVLANVHFFLNKPLVDDTLLDYEKIGLLFAAILHDYQHPGLNNEFFNYLDSGLSKKYNDIHVLENMHVNKGLKIMSDMGILDKFSTSKRKLIREMIIRVVISTDMSEHARLLERLKAQMLLEGNPLENNNNWKFDTNQRKDRMLLAEAIMHTSDIFHPCRPLIVHLEMSRRVQQEFYIQGDLMKLYEGWDVPTLFDRERNTVPSSQMGFINFVVFPMHKIWKYFLGEAHEDCIQAINKNVKFWDESKARQVLGCDFNEKPVEKGVIPWQCLEDLPSQHKTFFRNRFPEFCESKPMSFREKVLHFFACI